MKPAKLMLHYKQNKSLASREIGCTRATIGNWVKAGTIPIQWAALIEAKTGGKLKA